MNGREEEYSYLLERLRRSNWRLTAQRRAVAEVLSGPDIHLTAEEVLSRAKEVLPEISRATVYNTLKELTDRGELEEVQIFPGPVHYDPNAVVRHHHLVCSRCGKIMDIQPYGLDSLELPPEARDGFRLEQIDVIFRGMCEECA
jgi:Fur family ferric uptake transcriptional regulator